MKKFKILIFIISTLTITLTFFGCGNLIPYAMQPSYHGFNKMCELNKLPNNEEKYNKILAYFDLSLDSLDWEEINKEAENSRKLKLEIIDYFKNTTNYSSRIPKNKGRLSYNYIFIYSKDDNYSLQNLPKIKILVTWQTRDYHLKPKSVARSFELEWKEEHLSCEDIEKD